MSAYEELSSAEYWSDAASHDPKARASISGAPDAYLQIRSLHDYALDSPVLTARVTSGELLGDASRRIPTHMREMAWLLSTVEDSRRPDKFWLPHGSVLTTSEFDERAAAILEDPLHNHVPALTLVEDEQGKCLIKREVVYYLGRTLSEKDVVCNVGGEPGLAGVHGDRLNLTNAAMRRPTAVIRKNTRVGKAYEHLSGDRQRVVAAAQIIVPLAPRPRGEARRFRIEMPAPKVLIPVRTNI